MTHRDLCPKKFTSHVEATVYNLAIKEASIVSAEYDSSTGTYAVVRHCCRDAGHDGKCSVVPDVHRDDEEEQAPIGDFEEVCSHLASIANSLDAIRDTLAYLALPPCDECNATGRILDVSKPTDKLGRYGKKTCPRCDGRGRVPLP